MTNISSLAPVLTKFIKLTDAVDPVSCYPMMDSGAAAVMQVIADPDTNIRHPKSNHIIVTKKNLNIHHKIRTRLSCSEKGF